MACKSPLLFQAQTSTQFIRKNTIKNQIKEAFRKRFGMIKASNDIHVQWLFEYCLKLITENQWVYKSIRDPIDVLEQDSRSLLFVNCFDLADLLIAMSKELGLPSHLAERTVYQHKMSRRLTDKHMGVVGKFECFDARQKKHYLSEGNVFFFDKHCVAKINHHYYDLTFLCHYKNEFDIFDDSIKAQIFHFAAMNNLDKVRELINKNPQFNINSQAPDGETLLHIATSHCNLEMVQFLLENKIDANIANNHKQLPINHLVDYSSPIFEMLEKYTDKKIVLELIKANPERVFNSAITAIQNNNLGFLVHMLKNWNFNINQTDTYSGINSEQWTLLHWAAFYQNLEAAKILKIYNAKANIKTSLGDIPLKFVRPPNIELFNLLAESINKSEINTFRENYENMGAYYDQLFLEASTAMKENDLGKLKQMIADNKIGVNDQDPDGNTLLHWAAFNNNINAALYLLSIGAVFKENVFHFWPIHSLHSEANSELWSFLDHESEKMQNTSSDSLDLKQTTEQVQLQIQKQDQQQMFDDYNSMNGNVHNTNIHVAAPAPAANTALSANTAPRVVAKPKVSRVYIRNKW